MGIIYLLFSGLSSSSLYLPLYDYESIRGILLLALCVFDMQFFRKFKNYRKGYQGEKQVIEYLRFSLNDQYSLINDIKFPNSYSNIDHIVLTPNGIFVLETKNYSGKITCKGDYWSRQYKKTLFRKPRRVPNRSSPSKQARSNAMRIKEVIDSLETLKPLRIWVQGVVVFTNKDLELEIITPPLNIKIVEIKDLANYLMTNVYKHLSPQEIETIGKEIIKQT